MTHLGRGPVQHETAGHQRGHHAVVGRFQPKAREIAARLLGKLALRHPGQRLDRSRDALPLLVTDAHPGQRRAVVRDEQRVGTVFWMWAYGHRASLVRGGSGAGGEGVDATTASGPVGHP
ncbi:hypothetical protein [Micromonospora sagamiensis]|uniref:hypothetical protein n=1 Tax=Micromonospora sagamiensis TaxID=47875 RepID=UPI001E4A2038|nr:hypothetical protein [Micromonospora sagamiensis]